MRIQVTLILFPSVNLHFPNFLQGKCLTLVVRKKNFFNIILFKATELLPPLPQMKSYMKTQSVDPVKGVGVLSW